MSSGRNNNTTILPKGYDTIEYSKFAGNMKELSPFEKELASVMVRDNEMKNERGINRKNELPAFKIKAISDIVSNNIQAQTDLRSITPYIKRAEQIWTTLLTKPQGIQEQLLTYDTFDSEIKNTKLHRELCVIVENYFNNVYPIEDKVPQIIKDVMFRTGSYVLLNISHPALDHLINGMDVGGNESFRSELRDIERNIINNEFKGDRKTPLNIGWIRSKKEVKGAGGLESLFKPKAREPEYNLVDDFFKWTFTDNPLVLKVGALEQKIKENTLRETSGLESFESMIRTTYFKGKNNTSTNNNKVGITDTESIDKTLEKLYRPRVYKNKEQLSVRSSSFYTGSGRGIGLTYHPPSESCIPVHLNGEIGNPFGFIFLLDPDTGSFLKTTQDFKFYSSNKNREKVDNKNKQGSLNSIISNLKSVAKGNDCDFDMDWMIDFASSELEKQLVESFINGDKAAAVTVTLSEANKKIFLSRAMHQQGVRCLFVPAEYVTYFALDFNQIGTGKSLVDEAKAIITRIAMLDVADTIANIENAISKTLLTITTEEEDFDVENTVAQVRQKYLSNNPSLINYFGFYSVPIDNILDAVQNSLVRIKTNTQASNGINIEVEETQDVREGIKPVDQNSRDQALTSLANFFDLKRSYLEDSENGNDFAIEALADQELLRNTTIERSKTFSFFISDFIKKHIRCNEYLIGELVECIKNNKKDYEKPDQKGKLLVDSTDKDEATKVLIVLTDFLENLNVTLPLPASVESMNKLTDKIDAANKLVDSWKDMGVASSLFKSLSESLTASGSEQEFDDEQLMEMISALLKRKAFSMLNLPIPFDDVISEGKGGGVMSLLSDMTAMYENVVSFVDEYLKAKKTIDKSIEKVIKKHGGNTDDKDSEGITSDDSSDYSANPEEIAEEIVDEDNPDESTPKDDDTDEQEEGDENDGDEESDVDDIAEDLNKGMTF